MKIEVKQLSELKHPKHNVRMHPDKQIKELKRSIEKNGQTRLLVIDEEGVIWIGNGLYDAMVAMGYTEAYCIVKEGMSDNAKKKMMMSDNRIFDLGVDDMAAFDQLLIELGDDLDIPGYDDELLATLTADLQSVDDMLADYGLVDDDKKEEIREARETYEKKEAAFAAEAEELHPAPPPVVAQASPSVMPASAGDILHAPTQGAEEPAAETPPAEAAAQPKRSFILCPKCGERIWL